MQQPDRARDLPEEFALPLASGAEWWYWLGGRPALDLVNTLRERWRRRVETLVTPDDLGLWLVRAQLLPAPERVTPARLRDARELREAIDACVQAAVARAAAPPAAVAVIDQWLAHAGAQVRLDSPATGHRCSESGRRPTRCGARSVRSHSTPRNARHARGSRAHPRLRVGDVLGALLRSLAGGRRRWCSMALCGNEAKARRHRERSRGAPA